MEAVEVKLRRGRPKKRSIRTWRVGEGEVANISFRPDDYPSVMKMLQADRLELKEKWGFDFSEKEWPSYIRGRTKRVLAILDEVAKRGVV